MNHKIQLLHEKAQRIVLQHKTCEAELISVLQEIDECRAYLHFGFKSLYDYCVRGLGLSESNAYNFTSVSRKASQVPALKAAIDSGELTVSKARKVAPVLTKQNHEKWIALAKESSSREIEKAVAIEQPKLAVKETLKFVAEDRLSLTLGISETTAEKIKQVMDLESQRTKKPSSREDALVAALDAYLEKNDPLKKADRAVDRADKKGSGNESTHRVSKPVPGQVLRHSASHSAKARRPALPASLVHAVHMRDRRQCTFQYQNRRCGSTRWLEVHHIIPRSKGGGDALENLTTVCSAHHRLIHRE